jgi:hypothetical protein
MDQQGVPLNADEPVDTGLRALLLSDDESNNRLWSDINVRSYP